MKIIAVENSRLVIRAVTITMVSDKDTKIILRDTEQMFYFDLLSKQFVTSLIGTPTPIVTASPSPITTPYP